MPNIEQIVKSVKDLQERFLEAEVDTGDPADDVDTGPLGDGQVDELDAFVAVAQNSAISCLVAIDQMVRFHKMELTKWFGDEAEAVLSDAKEALQSIADLLNLPYAEDESDELEDSEESDEDSKNSDEDSEDAPSDDQEKEEE
jgi:hypothetical protein